MHDYVLQVVSVCVACCTIPLLLLFCLPASEISLRPAALNLPQLAWNSTCMTSETRTHTHMSTFAYNSYNCHQVVTWRCPAAHCQSCCTKCATIHRMCCRLPHTMSMSCCQPITRNIAIRTTKNNSNLKQSSKTEALLLSWPCCKYRKCNEQQTPWQ